MAKLVKKRIQCAVDQAILESVEYVMAKAGLTPATVLSMVYAEIARTGKIPVTTQADDNDCNTARLIAVSQHLPTVKVSTDAAVRSFLEDDGGY